MYALFAGEDHYPLGGWDDFKGCFDSIVEARAWYFAHQTEFGYDWRQIVDLDTKEAVESY